MRARKLGAIIGIVAAALWAPVASAAIPVTTIRLEVVFGGPQEFFASGGVLCSHGFATEEGFVAGFGSMGRGVGTFHFVKSMTCDNGDTFKLLVNAAASRTSPGTVGGFAAGQGTGSLTGLHGGGSLVGTGYPDGSGITDIYTGRLHIAP
jgi:hypothetical protein